ncbi:YSIRK-type signal peptide-containing protein, partial [Aedoeadaptatus acetigenes]|uniref:YSIRK-type signal peptide-containing protein n=1 Tax=Aedoeadaptatus acetigenes TaxID=2981723 RepID=UPI002265C899
MKQKEQCPRYGMRKLSVGFVSCLLGFTLIAGFIPGKSYASGAGGNDLSAAKRNGTVVEYRLTSHHGKHDKVDAKSSATSNEDVQRKSVEYDREKARIKWKALKHEISDIDGLWINGNQYTKGRKKDKLHRGQYYYDKGKVYINPGLRKGDVVNLKIKGKDNGFKYDGRNLNAIKDKDLFPLRTPNPIKVGDPNALTKAEKQEIIRQVKQLNPHAEKFEYNGKYLILYYPDGSRWGIRLATILVKDESKASEKELVKAKEEAKATVDQLDELSKDEKTDAKTSIDQAADKEAIDKIVNGAKQTNNERAQAKKELAKAKEEAKATVDQLDELSKDEKTNTKASIDQAGDKEAIDKIVNEATKTNNERAQVKKELAKAKEEAKAT